ncbi:MAG TPA: hypothetical protein VF978_01065 [Gemmatimonadales bacterium]
MGRAVLIVLLVAACGGSADKAAPAVAQTAAAGDPRAAIFVQKGCPQCHPISALGITSPAEVGPDLTGAYDDVRTRFGVKLDEFFAAPTGTMQVVLSSMIRLSPAERDSIIGILKQLHEQREERKEQAS